MIYIRPFKSHQGGWFIGLSNSKKVPTNKCFIIGLQLQVQFKSRMHGYGSERDLKRSWELNISKELGITEYKYLPIKYIDSKPPSKLKMKRIYGHA